LAHRCDLFFYTLIFYLRASTSQEVVFLSITALKGFKDIVPGEVETWQFIEKTARDIFHCFDLAEIKVPILEKTELFIRSIGETTDIVEKEMYTFIDRNGASLTMRPEGTASVLRAYIENGLLAKKAVQKLYTIGPMFRHERPQKGRLRQFHQMSVEVLGSDHPRVDAELMAMAWLILKKLGLSAGLEINSLGCPSAGRPSMRPCLIFCTRRKISAMTANAGGRPIPCGCWTARAATARSNTGTPHRFLIFSAPAAPAISAR